MAAISPDALLAIQSRVQPKLVENGWVAEETDTTLSEYVSMMLVNGKNVQGVKAELGGDLLGVGEEDPAVGAFAEWLFEEVQALTGPATTNGSAQVETQQQGSESQHTPAQDSEMDDAKPVDGAPSGPKAMRNGVAGRGGRDRRMLGQMNNHMNRDQLPESLRRIRGAAGGQQGRINSHAGRDPPRGPKDQNLARGVQRAMGGGRGAHAQMNQMNPMQQGNMMNSLNPQQQMAFMQMMEMQANMMTQMLQNGQAPNFGQQNGAGQNKSLFDRVDKRPNGHFKSRQQQRHTGSQNGDAASSMDVDSESGVKKDLFETECKFNTNCTNPNCPFAHQTPAAPPKPADQKLDMTDTCPFGASCTNTKCTARHPSPASRGSKQEVDCKFFPNCTNLNCPFRHPDAPPCRNGADCNIPGCKFTHSKINCRYNPCTKPFCPFKHVEGQKGVFKDKVWTADGVPELEGEGGETANRFALLKENEGQAEELIIPGQSSEGSQLPAETQIMT